MLLHVQVQQGIQRQFKLQQHIVHLQAPQAITLQILLLQEELPILTIQRPTVREVMGIILQLFQPPIIQDIQPIFQ